MTTSTEDTRTADWPEYYGVRLIDVGEDGDVVILGHPDARRALAALNCHARKVWGEPRGLDDPGAADNLTREWARFMTDCEDEELHRWNIEDHGECWNCEQITIDKWHIRWDVKPTDPGAFPITHWGP
jgi:hypothetical protein